MKYLQMWATSGGTIRVEEGRSAVKFVKIEAENVLLLISLEVQLGLISRTH